jgi:N-acetylmuramoyl-L-alanine amidase
MAVSAFWRWVPSGLAFVIAVAHAPVAGAPQAQGAGAEWPTTVIPKTSARAEAPETPAASGQAAKPSSKGPMTIATAASLDGDEQRTSFRLELSKGVTAEIFTLANPYRVVVDLPDVAFELPSTSGREERGLVKTFRYGLFAEGKARIVIDTNGPVRIERAAMAAATRGKGIVFTFDLLPTAPDVFGMGTGAARQEKAHPKPNIKEEILAKPKNRGKTVVMIDPGHGGIDGGAIGASHLLEKNVVLAVAKEVRKALSASGRYDVRMTRTTDIFISLDQRLAASQKSGAELFISLHADSLAESGYTQSIRGATVYTLSERASDEQARLMAEKENASDLVAGLIATDSEGSDQVRNILFDLMKRETANFSADFSNVLVRKLKSSLTLSRDPQRSAAFKVLKQTHAPSVLVELGYLSHLEDEKLLNTPQWQKLAAASIAGAIDAYFAKRTVSTP